ncbi:hypothetical protein D3C86_1880800 [compost metagenome]
MVASAVYFLVKFSTTNVVNLILQVIDLCLDTRLHTIYVLTVNQCKQITRSSSNCATREDFVCTHLDNTVHGATI